MFHRHFKLILSKIELNTLHGPASPAPSLVFPLSKCFLIRSVTQARTLGIALDSPTPLPLLNLLPSSDDASLIHSHLSTLTPTQNLQFVPERGEVEKVGLRQAFARQKAFDQGEGTTCSRGMMKKLWCGCGSNRVGSLLAIGCQGAEAGPSDMGRVQRRG